MNTKPMSRLIPNVSIVQCDASSVPPDARENNLIFLSSEPKDTDKYKLNKLAKRSNVKIVPYLNHWCIRSVMSMKKESTKEELALERMIFDYLWDVHVRKLVA